MFRIKSFTISNHQVLGDQIISFVDDNDISKGYYNTLLIGPNGSGKSLICYALIEAINYLQLKDKSNKPTFRFEITVIREDHVRKYTEEEEEAVNIGKLIFYSSVVKDNAPYRKTKAKYVYEGIRAGSTSNAIYINNIYKNLMHNLLECAGNHNKVNVLRSICETLKFGRYIEPVLKKRKMYELLFTYILNDLGRNKSIEEIPIAKKIEIQNDLVERYRKQKGSLTSAKSIQFLSDSKKFNKFLSLVFDYPLIASVDSEFLSLSDLRVDLYKDSVEVSKSILDYIDFLNSLGIASVENFRISVNDKQDPKGEDISEDSSFIEAMNLSSGELGIFRLLTSILAQIDKNSIVIIDEPEISMHPSWQMKLFNFLKMIQDAYPSTHFIVSSHCHFIVSDLPKDNSCILRLSNDNGAFSAQQLTQNGYNTFGWSAEQILLEVFQVVTDRNYYVSLQIEELIEMIDDPSINDELLNAKKLELRNIRQRMSLKKGDPLDTIIKELTKNVQ